jgi:hypothetical protein
MRQDLAHTCRLAGWSQQRTSALQSANEPAADHQHPLPLLCQPVSTVGGDVYLPIALGHWLMPVGSCSMC